MKNRKTISDGITKAISAAAMLSLLQKNRQALVKPGYDFMISNCNFKGPMAAASLAPAPTIDSNTSSDGRWAWKMIIGFKT